MRGDDVPPRPAETGNGIASLTNLLDIVTVVFYLFTQSIALS